MIEIQNGQAYQDGKPIILHAIDVEPRKKYQLRVIFSDGVAKIYDFSQLLETEAFRPLKDEEKFNRVILDHGVPTWEAENVDISPETIYANGTSV